MIFEEKNYIYFDHNATTNVEQKVIEGMYKISSISLNASSIHAFGRYARSIIEKTRLSIKKAFNIPYNCYTLFTSSGTEANNMLFNIRIDTILTSQIEHSSILQKFTSNHHKDDYKNKNNHLIKCNNEGIIETKSLLSSVEKCINQSIDPQTILVSIMLANNESGTIQDIENLSASIKAFCKSYYPNKKIFFHTDATQAAGKIAVDFQKLNVDAMTISGHKFGGPLGAASLIIKKELADNFLSPLITGGGQEYRFRSGTHNTPAIHGLGIACNLIESRIEKIQKSCKELTNQIKYKIENISPGSILLNKTKETNILPNTVLIFMPNVSAETQVIYFDTNSIAVSAGAACSSGKVQNSHVLSAMGYPNKIINNTIRVSLSYQNNEREVQKFISLWQQLYYRQNNGKAL